MKKIVGVRFKRPGKIYFFDPQNLQVKLGDYVVVETAQGDEYGEVAITSRELPEEKLVAPLKKVIRIANDADKNHYEENKRKEEKANNICLEKIKKHNLDMNLIDVEYKFDNSKIVFYFTADGRIDFRELVKDLAAVLKNRIELRQIGVRDEIKRIGGNGMCGRELCCCSFLGSFETVSIKMAKEQNISLTPSKIAGNCGRLMCCLKYEQNVYEEKLSKLPKIGAIVETKDGIGEICGIETLKERVKVKLEDNGESFFKRYDAKEIKVIKEGVSEDEIDADKEELQELENMEKLDRLENEEN